MNSYIKLMVQLSLLVFLSVTTQASCEIYNRYETLDIVDNKHKRKKNSTNINKLSKDVNRFIAHAGGQIDGNRYTNSLEALNLNYKLGFRLFELDIIETSDNIYVASHDWERWADSTDYKGRLPPNREIFKKHKILGKYTPLDMTDINIWFNNHPDAILVTDKVNKPLYFSYKFIDKNRLVMELFSLGAVKDGIKANIKSAMPSWSVLSTITGDKVKKLKSMGVVAIAASRSVINDNKNLLNSLNKAGIKIFAFHVNLDKSKNEVYVVCNEMDYFYGIYADKWDFKSELDCRKMLTPSGK